MHERFKHLLKDTSLTVPGTWSKQVSPCVSSDKKGIHDILRIFLLELKKTQLITRIILMMLSVLNFECFPNVNGFLFLKHDYLICFQHCFSPACPTCFSPLFTKSHTSPFTDVYIPSANKISATPNSLQVQIHFGWPTPVSLGKGDFILP